MTILAVLENEQKIPALNELLTEIQPATINVLAGKACTPAQRDVIRAQKVKDALQER